jgi:hypothetical protein
MKYYGNGGKYVDVARERGVRNACRILVRMSEVKGA